MKSGWICPVCKSVHAPFVVGCFCSQGFQTEGNKTPEVGYHVRLALVTQQLESLSSRIGNGDFEKDTDIIREIQTIVKGANS